APADPQRRSQLVSEDEFDEHLRRDSVALRLWDFLRHNRPGDSKWKRGPTTSKIMARKRPSLIPIEDSVVKDVIGLGWGDRGGCGGKHSTLKATTSNRVLQNCETKSVDQICRRCESST